MLSLEGLESRCLLTVTAAAITSITSTADADGSATDEHVEVIQGSTTPVLVGFSYTATKTSTATLTVANPGTDLTATLSGLASGTGKTGTFSIDVSALSAGSHNVRLVVDDADPGSRNDKDPDAIEIYATITDSLNVNATVKT